MISTSAHHLSVHPPRGRAPLELYRRTLNARICLLLSLQTHLFQHARFRLLVSSATSHRVVHLPPSSRVGSKQEEARTSSSSSGGSCDAPRSAGRPGPSSLSWVFPRSLLPVGRPDVLWGIQEASQPCCSFIYCIYLSFVCDYVFFRLTLMVLKGTNSKRTITSFGWRLAVCLETK